ncbi:MAG TPA: DUF92 domain-containing protein [Thermoanaerobaculia bacterium]|nr:DUF92 domain-containing protein [Thermoanaerobaculia bacterium]
MAFATNEPLRKSIHIAVGLGAFALPWIPWRYAALVAAAFIVINWLLLHRLVGRGVARHERGWDAGIVLYPAAVCALILVFNWHIEIAAVAWALMAFGDGFATVIGRVLPIAALPWNRQKSWGGTLAFLVFGGAAAFAVGMQYGGHPRLEALALVVVASAFAETLPLGLNDNIVVPLVAGVVLAATGIAPFASSTHPSIAWPWLAVHTVLALAGWLLRTVDLSGAIAGWILGAVIVVGGGPALYVALLAFFVVSTAATKLGYTKKASEGLAQERGGRRGAAHAFANVGVAAICAVACWRGLGLVPLFMGVAALATAAADTAGSEIGQLVGRVTFLPLSFRRVARGTEGAISLEGTLAGIVAAFIVGVSAVAMAVHHLRPGFTGTVVIDRFYTPAVLTACGFLGSYIESILGGFNRRAGSPVPNGAMNFINTVIGALLFWIAWNFVPMFGFEF